MRLFTRLFGIGRPKRVTRNWENLPSCTMMILESFDCRQILAAARSAHKDVIGLIPLGTHIDPTTGVGQIDALYRFADDSSLGVLTWRGIVFVRRTFLANTSLDSHAFADFIRELSAKAKRQGLRCDSA